MTSFRGSRVAIALWKRIEVWWKKFRCFLDNVIRFQKETLQEYTEHLFVFFVGLCGYQNLTNQFFLREVAKNVKNWKILLFRQLCGHLRIFSKKLQMFLKTIFGYRVQFFLNCEPARKIYKKVNKISKKERREFSLVSNTYKTFF